MGDDVAGPSAGLYEVIHRRRDVRAEFNGAPVDPVVLDPSARRRPLRARASGLSQPWDFVLVTDDATRRAFWEHVQGDAPGLRRLARG